MTCTRCQGDGLVRERVGGTSRGAKYALVPCPKCAPTLSPPARLVLGAVPPGEGYCSVRDRVYWAPCMSRAVAEDGGGFTSEPHLWFICAVTARSFYCPACLADRDLKPENVIDGTASAPKAETGPIRPVPESAPANPPQPAISPAAHTPIPKPWGDERPIWGDPKYRFAAPTDPTHPRALEAWWSERAAIIEYDAGEPRPRAELLAYEMLLRTLGVTPASRQIGML